MFVYLSKTLLQCDQTENLEFKKYESQRRRVKPASLRCLKRHVGYLYSEIQLFDMTHKINLHCIDFFCVGDEGK